MAHIQTFAKQKPAAKNQNSRASPAAPVLSTPVVLATQVSPPKGARKGMLTTQARTVGPKPQRNPFKKADPSRPAPFNPWIPLDDYEDIKGLVSGAEAKTANPAPSSSEESNPCPTRPNSSSSPSARTPTFSAPSAATSSSATRAGTRPTSTRSTAPAATSTPKSSPSPTRSAPRPSPSRCTSSSPSHRPSPTCTTACTGTRK
jgi:hypothetical protein